MIQECQELHCTKMSLASHCVEHLPTVPEECELCENKRVFCPGCSADLLAELQTSSCGVLMRCPLCVGYGEALEDKTFADSNPTPSAKLNHEFVIITCLDLKFPNEKEWKEVMKCAEPDSEDERTECEFTNCTNLTDNENELCTEHNHSCSGCEADGAEFFQSRYYCETCLLEVKRPPTPVPTQKKKEPVAENKRKMMQELKELPTKRPKTEQQLYEEKAERLQIQLYTPNEQGDPEIRPANGKFKSFKRSLREIDEWEQEITRASNSMEFARSKEDEKFILRHLMSRASFLAKKKKNRHC